MSYNIVHIATHLGGGAGSVLMNWVKADKTNMHKILCLNYNYSRVYDRRIVLVNMRNRAPAVREYIARADIVIVHFWNHPLLFDFLVNMDIPECRLCFWSHVSGLNAPYVISEKLVKFSDRFVFSSPISYEAKEIIALPASQKNKLSHIWTTGDIAEFSKIKPRPHDGFNIGCIVSLDYSKLHPKFIDFCSKINIPDVTFIMISDGCDSEKIRQQVEDRGLKSKFIFTGHMEDIKPYLGIIDVFGYPLNPNHFGTCEQVIGEAVAAGIIPVVMKNPAEEFIFLKSLVRFSCASEEEYVRAIEMLYENRHKRTSVIDIMQESIVNLYDTGRMVRAWNDMFHKLITMKKRKRVWTKSYIDHPISNGARVFIESLGDYGKIFEYGSIEDIKKLFATNRQWGSRDKGSPRQYFNTSKTSPMLLRWAILAEEVWNEE